jgi:hypothetical protein
VKEVSRKIGNFGNDGAICKFKIRTKASVKINLLNNGAKRCK